MHKSYWFIITLLACLFISVPIFTIIYFLGQPNLEIWQYLWETSLLGLLWNTLRLAIGVGVGTFLLGSSLAWLVVMYEFPGRRFFEGTLILPLAMPGYVIGFVFLSQWDYTGTIPTALRQWTGSGISLFEFKSYPGLVLVLTLVLYPYVFLLARGAFREQNVTLFEVATSLGKSRKQLFWQVALPLARPSIATGVLLALMETMADFGTVSLFTYDAFTTAIYQLWFGFFNKEAAIQLAGLLFLFTLGLFYIEGRTRGRAKYYQIQSSIKPRKRFELTGYKLFLAFLFPALVLGVAFVYPVIILLFWVFQNLIEFWNTQYFHLIENTLLVASTSALLVLGIALIMAYGKRLFPNMMMTGMTRFASMGYALPGSVIAVGILLPLTTADHWVNQLTESWFNLSLGLIFTGSILGLIFAYTVRFLAVSFNSVDHLLSTITPTMDMAALSLGAGRKKILKKIHLPLIKTGMVTGLIVVFIDVTKEMPATLLLRPFGFNTLSTRIWELTEEAYWEAAALPALTIVLVALIPVALLIKWGNSSSSQE